MEKSVTLTFCYCILKKERITYIDVAIVNEQNYTDSNDKNN